LDIIVRVVVAELCWAGRSCQRHVRAARNGSGVDHCASLGGDDSQRVIQ
jgi:hypothetical protein